MMDREFQFTSSLSYSIVFLEISKLSAVILHIMGQSNDLATMTSVAAERTTNRNYRMMCGRDRRRRQFEPVGIRDMWYTRF
jgi:hypothetical protein